MKNGIKKTLLKEHIEKKNSAMKQFIEANDLDPNISSTDLQRELQESQDYWLGAFTGRDFAGNSVNLPRMPLSEALKTDDVSIVLPRVIKTILQEPKEPAYFLTNEVAEVMRMSPSDPQMIEFPTVGAVTAGYVGENGDYPNMNLMFGENKVTMRIRKIGLMGTLSDEVIAESRYAMVTLYMRAAAAGIRRKNESALFDVLVNKAHVVFDNNLSDSDYHTTGKAYDQTPNLTLSYFDLLTMTGVLYGNRYQATHVLGHPLGYSFIQMDPYMRATFMHQGQIGGNAWSKSAAEDLQSQMPFNLTYVPYYALAYSEHSTLTSGAGSGLDPVLVSDVYVIDKNNSLYFANRGELEMDSMEDWYKDAKTIKVKQYVDYSTKDGGRGMTVARNIRMTRNFEPIMTVHEV